MNIFSQFLAQYDEMHPKKYYIRKFWDTTQNVIEDVDVWVPFLVLTQR